jgi:hypothetical protein
MPRTNAAPVRTQPDSTATHDPANDVTPSETARIYTLTAADRQRYTALALGLTKFSRRAPTHMNQRFDWVSAIQARARRDQSALAQVSFGAAPVTPDEIDDLGLRIEFAREVFAARGLVHERSAASAGADPAAMTDAELAAECRQHQLTLCDPLVRRFRQSHEPAATLRPKRKAAQSVARGRGVRLLASNNATLFALCDDPAVTGWLPTLLKGESQALARLRELHPEWVRRAGDATSSVGAPGVSDLAPRAWALVTEPLPRILEGGRYLVKGDARRARDYRGFQARKTRKAATKEIAVNNEAPATPPAP